MACHVCPWWMAYTFDHRGRRLFHKPEKILGPYVKPGMTVMDLGCGMGYFTIPTARMVGETGKVIAVDLQQKMLDVLMKRARRAGVAPTIEPHLCASDDIGIKQPVDFASAFFMVHETPAPDRLFEQVHACLKPGALFMIVEPRGEVDEKAFEQTLTLGDKAGFKLKDRLNIRVSRGAVLRKP